jgi:cytochrome c peroxidase
MKSKFFILIVLLVVTLPFVLDSCNTKKTANAEADIKHYYSLWANTLLKQLDTLHTKANTQPDVSALQKIFETCRFTYKRIEPVTEYYFQGLTKRINGPALPDVKTEDGTVWPPHGFQVIEQLLFNNFSNNNITLLNNEIKLLQTDISFTISSLQNITISNKHIEELLQHELIRIAALGISGFDTPLSKLALSENIYCLKSIKQIMLYAKPTAPTILADSCIQYLENNANFNNFNRLGFITDLLAPLSKTIVNEIAVKDSLIENKPFKGGLYNLIQQKSFNADYYVNYDIGKTNADKVALGKLLFYDNALSKTNTISCASCHKPALFFTDGKKIADNFVHGGSLQRNTPTLFYAALQANQFYDVRATSLEDQINEVMSNGNEFNFKASNAIKRMSANKTYTNYFAKAFNTNDTISSYQIRNAIAAYIRSLTPFSSNFDAYLSGNKSSLQPSQIEGFNLFMGKAKCGSCHFFPLFNGTVPPWFNKSESEIIGVPGKPIWQNTAVDNDSGRYKINAFEELLYAFKTPTIRNAAKTAPYMHNGVYNTLHEVVTFYNKGGGVGLGMKLPFQTLPFDSLQLSSTEQKALIAFMEALTDKQ